MTLPAITNATLTQVNVAGLTAEWDRDATAGALKWQGSERILAVEAVQLRTQSEAGHPAPGGSDRRSGRAAVADVLVDRTLVVRAGLAAFAQGDIVTFTQDGLAAETGIVRWVGTTTDPTSPGVTRLVLSGA